MVHHHPRKKLQCTLLVWMVILVIGIAIGLVLWWKPIPKNNTPPTTNPEIIESLLLPPSTTNNAPIAASPTALNVPPAAKNAFTPDDVFPINEANYINKPYSSSVSQCHFTDFGCTQIRNVRWREPISDIFTYDIDPPPYPPTNPYPFYAPYPPNPLADSAPVRT